MPKVDAVFYGNKLRLARTFNGLTLADLGEKVSVTRQYIQKLESDSGSAPAEDMLSALAEILHINEAFFFTPLSGEVFEDVCHFRKLQTTPHNVKVRALSYGTILNQLLRYIEDKINLPSVNIPKVDQIASTFDIEKAAEKCRVNWGLGLDTPIMNVVRVLEANGCVVTTFRGISKKIDAFSYYRERPIIVRSLEKASSSRARFDVAHEAGHIVMHPDQEVGDILLEEQANRFASAFLLPRAAFVNEFPMSSKINWRRVVDLKIHWGVSIQAIIRRAYDLNMINAVQYRNANIYISRNGWRQNEPHEDSIIFEREEVLPKAIQNIYQAFGLSADRIAQELGLSCCVLNEFNIDCVERRDDNDNLVYLNNYRSR